MFLDGIEQYDQVGDEDYSYEYPEAQSQIPIQSQSSYRSFESEQSYPSSSTWSQNPSSTNRHEILQTKVKGYRESTYWGSEHPPQEKVDQMNDDEFDRFIDDVELNDADVYWSPSQIPQFAASWRSGRVEPSGGKRLSQSQ